MKKRHDALLAPAAACAVAALALGVATGASAFSTTAQASCGTFAGPAWKLVSSLDGTTRKGTTWNVTARGAPCAYAKVTARTLVKTPFKGEARTRLRSPKGWSCLAGGGNSHIGPGTPGYCSQGSKSFTWGPAIAG